jgi:hypothetical protein
VPRGRRGAHDGINGVRADADERVHRAPKRGTSSEKARKNAAKFTDVRREGLRKKILRIILEFSDPRERNGP